VLPAGVVTVVLLLLLLPQPPTRSAAIAAPSKAGAHIFFAVRGENVISDGILFLRGSTRNVARAPIAARAGKTGTRKSPRGKEAREPSPDGTTPYVGGGEFKLV
jgi:hypothetical protein